MPITVPAIDARSYQQLRDEGLRRIPVHNPEWTNFNASDPGVTLVEVFAFLTESLLYRANQIPERNRLKFLQLLGLPLAPASAAQGLVQFNNERGPLATTTLPTGLVLNAGALMFRTLQGLDVLPVEARVCFKREVTDASTQLRAYYDQLYASFLQPPLPAGARLYEVLPLTGDAGIDLGTETVDQAFWVALAARPGDVAGRSGKALAEALDEVRSQIASKTLTLGIVPWLQDASRELRPGSATDAATRPALACDIPLVPADGKLPTDAAARLPRYRPLPVIGGDVLARPGTLQVVLPDKAALRLWTNLDPLEAGVGDFPPALEDTPFEGRILTWLRFSVPAGTPSRLLWAGINSAEVAQRERISAERLPTGNGAPDQQATLARRPVLAGSVRLFVTPAEGGPAREWLAIDDLLAAGAEVPVPDPRLPPGARQPVPANPYLFQLDAEAGLLRFGDGAHGARPPLGARLAVDYQTSSGRAGNVNAGAINGGPTLPPGFKVANPVATWGGADAERVADGEKQVQRWLQHRDRAVSAEDFAAIVWRTPGVLIGRVDVVPASSPELGVNDPGDAAGAVTLMLVPRNDPGQADAPRPDRLFLDTVCAWIEPRRLVTTEVFLRGPSYLPIWLSVGIDVAGERSVAEVRQAVEAALRAALAVLPPADQTGVAPLLPVFQPDSASSPATGWPLRKPIVALELAAVVARVSGVSAVRELQLAGAADTNAQASLPLRGLQLPRIAGLSVSIGPALPVLSLKGVDGAGGPASGGGTLGFVPVPVLPDHC